MLKRATALFKERVARICSCTSPLFKTDVMLMDIDDNNVFSNSIFMSFLCLPLFTKELDECENDFERWIYILRNMDKLERMPASLQDAVWKRLFGVCDVRKCESPDFRGRSE